MVAALIGSAIWIDYWVYREIGYEGPNHADKMEILSSRIYFVPDVDGKSIAVVGQLRNTGTNAVDYVKVEVQLFDSNDELIDSFRGTLNDHIEAGQEVSFKFSNWENIHLPEQDYATHKVLFREATRR